VIYLLQQKTMVHAISLNNFCNDNFISFLAKLLPYRHK
jgi:hypothetical protein